MASPPLPSNLDHLRNGRRVWFYRNSPDGSHAACRGTVVGRGTDPETHLMALTIAPDSPLDLAHEITKGGTVRRTVNGVFPDRHMLESHLAFITTASPDEVAAWTKSIIELSAMIGGREEKHPPY